MSQRSFARLPLTGLACIGLTLVNTSAGADESSALQEVIVTAQKHEENIQTVPLAISALTSADLAQKGITSFDGVAQATPSISFSPFPTSAGTLILYMRGQGQADPGQLVGDGAVGLYEDGFYIGRPQASIFDLADVERVEVLRGPQGTLYGRNTTGGAVNIISKQPTGEFDLRQEFSFGTRNLFRSLTAVNLPAAGRVAAKMTVLRSAIDGYVRNAGSGHDFGEQAQFAGRLQLHADVTDTVAADYFMDKGTLDSTPGYAQDTSLNGATLYNGYVYHAKSGPMSRSYRPIELQPSTARIENHGLTLTWDASDALTLKSLTGYRKLDDSEYQDFADVFQTPLALHYLYHQHQFSQELQFIGDVLDSRLNYVAGLYYFKESGSHLLTQNLYGYGITTTSYTTAESDTKAVYGQLTWTPPLLDDNLELTLGGRFTRDHKQGERYQTFNGAPVPGENGGADGAYNNLDFSRFNPSATINYRWSPDVSTYLKFSTGYRAGGFITSSGPGKFRHTYSPEDLRNIEAGLKSYWLEHRLRANLTAFDSKITDMQMVFNGDPSDPTVSQAYNAGEATIRGVEAELQLLPIDDLMLGINYTYLDAVFDKVDVIAGTNFDGATNPASPYHVGDNISELFAVPHAPRHSLDLSADYTFYHFDTGALSLHAGYRWQDRYHFQATSGAAVPNHELDMTHPYGLLDARLTLAVDLPRGDSAKISLWGKNITHQRYVEENMVQGSPVAVGATPAGFTNAPEFWAPPPSLGIDLVYTY